MAYDIAFNGIRTKTKGVAVTTRPSIPVPKKRVSFVEVAGMDGSLTVTDGTYEDISIQVSMNFIRSVKYWHETARDIRNWLNGPGILRLSNLFDWHYRVKAVILSDMENINRMGGRFTAQFLCDPFQYHDGGDSFLPRDECLMNPYYMCKPVYRVVGTGERTLTVNKTSWTLNIPGDHIIVDAEKKLVYDDSGANLRPYTKGDFEDLYLHNGVNQIFSSGTVTVKPNWRSL